MLNRTYTFPTKETGPANCIYDGLYYGTEKFTWNFDIHFPVLTKEYAEDMTGEALLSLQNGSTEKVESELLKIARLTKSYIMSRVPLIARKHLEYRIAKDEDLLNEILQAQIEILQTWGGYDSLYTVEDGANEKSIGQAGINYLNSLDIFITYYVWRLEASDYRSDY
jgi:hypothetical protein